MRSAATVCLYRRFSAFFLEFSSFLFVAAGNLRPAFGKTSCFQEDTTIYNQSWALNLTQALSVDHDDLTECNGLCNKSAPCNAWFGFRIRTASPARYFCFLMQVPDSKSALNVTTPEPGVVSCLEKNCRNCSSTS